MGSPKGMLVLLAMIAILFGVGLWLGAGRDQGGDRGPEEFALARGISRIFLKKSKLDSGDLGGPCYANGIFTLAGAVPCRVTVAASKTHLRTLPLRLDAGAKVTLVFAPNDEQALPVKISLRAGKNQTLQVPSGGGALTLHGDGISTFCVVRLAD